MALVFSDTKCAICAQILKDKPCDEREYVATSHFIGDRSHHLWRFSDAAMHKQCFMNWEHRKEFVQLFNKTVSKQVSGSGFSHRMNDDGEIIKI